MRTPSPVHIRRLTTIPCALLVVHWVELDPERFDNDPVREEVGLEPSVPQYATFEMVFFRLPPIPFHPDKTNSLAGGACGSKSPFLQR